MVPILFNITKSSTDNTVSIEVADVIISQFDNIEFDASLLGFTYPTVCKMTMNIDSDKYSGYMVKDASTGLWKIAPSSLLYYNSSTGLYDTSKSIAFSSTAAYTIDISITDSTGSNNVYTGSTTHLRYYQTNTTLQYVPTDIENLYSSISSLSNDINNLKNRVTALEEK